MRGWSSVVKIHPAHFWKAKEEWKYMTTEIGLRFWRGVKSELAGLEGRIDTTTTRELMRGR